ncbi:MAG: amidase [Desulfobacterales bacterium]|nr:amidase [Desulfobacterales bacterium]
MSALQREITGMNASQLSATIRNRQVRCIEVMRAYLERIHRYNPVYNAIVGIVDDDVLMDHAADADRALEKGEYRGWMHGMPHAVKDLASVKGLKTSFGSRVFAETVAGADDLHIARIRNQGAIFIGKTNTPEFGLGSQTYNEVYGTTRNAYDPNLTAGGSSGGAAAGLALQMLPVADGSDMMGSLRNPAGYNNVIGFRPSQGRVPGVYAMPAIDIYYHQLAVDGPLGRTVEDTVRLLVTMAGYDSRAPLSLRDEVPPFDRFQPAELKGFRIGWMGDYEGYLATDPGLLALCEAALDEISGQGVVVEPCRPAYDMARLWETWLTLRHWIVGSKKPLYDDPEKRKLLKPEFVWEIEGSFDMPASRLTEAAKARTDWYRALHALFDRYDLLALPSAQVFPFPAETHWPAAIDGRAMDTYHRWMEVVIGGTLAGLPVVNLPAGFDDLGRPMGMQFMGPMGDDCRVLEFALAWEAATDHLARNPMPVAG